MRVLFIRPHLWLDDRYRYGDVVYRPAKMDPDDLAARCVAARRTFYAYGAIARRWSNVGAHARTPRHLALFLAANLISRRDLSYKLGRPLCAAESGVSQCGSMPVPRSWS